MLWNVDGAEIALQLQCFSLPRPPLAMQGAGMREASGC